MTGLSWDEIDPQRFKLEKSLLKNPWRFVQDQDGRYAWEGGLLRRRKPDAEHAVRLIYPYGFPSRFIEARLQPELPTVFSGALGTHVNTDGSICYITAEGWTPQDTASAALKLLQKWWKEYYWLIGITPDSTPDKRIPER